MSYFSDALKAYRNERGLTQAELAEKLGISKGAVGNYEAGMREPDFDLLKRLADVLYVSATDLTGISQQPMTVAELPAPVQEIVSRLLTFSPDEVKQVNDFISYVDYLAHR